MHRIQDFLGACARLQHRQDMVDEATAGAGAAGAPRRLSPKQTFRPLWLTAFASGWSFSPELRDGFASHPRLPRPASAGHDAHAFAHETCREAPGRGDTGWDGTSASILLSGHRAPGIPPATTLRGKLGSGVRLPRALQALAHEAVVTEDGPHPPVGAEPTAPQCARVILAGRATSVPFTAVLDGPQRTTTDNHEAPSTCAVPRPRR
jgi:hypothetical protein